MTVEFYGVSVRLAQRITPRTIRVTFAGDSLRAYAAMGLPDDHLMVFVPPPGEPLVLPRFEGRWVYDEAAPKPTGRHYTIRRMLGDEMDIDFFVHDGGVASKWAECAKPGDTAALTAAGSQLTFPPDADWMLLAGDSSAVPAAGRIIEELPAGMRAFAFLEVEDALEEQEFESAADVSITWLHRRNGDTPGRQLEPAVRAFGWPEGRAFAWAAGETSMVQGLRKFVRDERGLAKPAFSVVGYWKQRLTEDQWVDRRHEIAGADIDAQLTAARKAGVSEDEFWARVQERIEEAGLG